jgi:hypothetical protein
MRQSWEKQRMDRAQFQKQIQLPTPRITLVDDRVNATSTVVADLLENCWTLSRDHDVRRSRPGATMVKFFWGIDCPALRSIDWIAQT